MKILKRYGYGRNFLARAILAEVTSESTLWQRMIQETIGLSNVSAMPKMPQLTKLPLIVFLLIQVASFLTMRQCKHASSLTSSSFRPQETDGGRMP